MKSVYKIFAYGSLINLASLKNTVPEARNIFPVKTYGLQRVFNLASEHRFDPEHNRPICVLNIAEAETGSVLNGTCFEMDKDSLDNLLEREKGYDFCQLEVHDYNNEAQSFEAHYFRAHQFTPHKYLSNSSVQQHYLNLCIQGSQEFGNKFLEDFKTSTSFWELENEDERHSIWSGTY